jgi:type IV pilus assembly protein PilO
MTNLQKGAPLLHPQQLQRLWLGLPIAAGALLASALAALVLVPQWRQFQLDRQRLSELEDLRDQVVLMRRHLSTLDETEQKVAAQQAKLFELVAGSGDLSTFVATLDQEARAAGVQMELYEPQVSAAPAADGKPATGNSTGEKGGGKAGTPGAKGGTDAKSPPTDLFEVEGLRRRSVLVSAKGSFPQLLTFLRGLEERNVLVVQSDLQVMLEEAKATDPKSPPPPAPVVLKVVMSLYGKDDTPATKPGDKLTHPSGRPGANVEGGKSAPPST